MVTTIYRISEQVLLLLKNGAPDAATTVELPDIKLAVGQVLNKLYKAEYFNVTLPSNDTIPQNAHVCTYEVAVEQYKDVSKATLPVLPISLPRGIGVLEVYPLDGSDNYDATAPIIPVMSGQKALVKDLMNDLVSYTYEQNGLDLIFNKDLTADSISNVLVKLVVMDVSQYGDYDVLPIPASDENTVVMEVFKLMAAQLRDKGHIVDSIKEE